VSCWTYLRWQRDESRRGPVYPPLTDDHPSVLSPCLLCKEQLGTVLVPQLFVVGPVDDDEWDAHMAGAWYAATAVIVHEVCLLKLDAEHLEDAVAEIAASVRNASS